MALRDISVTPEDIDGEFHSQHQRLAEFKKLVLICNDPLVKLPADVTKKMGLRRVQDKKAYEAAQSNYKRWIKDEQLPYSVQAVLSLHNFGIFTSTKDTAPQQPIALSLAQDNLAPFGFQNTRMRIASIINAAAYWRGYIPTPGTSRGEVEVHSQFGDTSIDKLISRWVEKAVYIKDYNQNIKLQATLSKFLKILGGYRGRKVAMVRALPLPVEEALASWETATDLDERQIAFEIICDFVLAFFAGDKVKYSKSRGFSATLSFHLDQTQADKKLQLFRQTLAIARPDIRTWSNAAHQKGTIGRKTQTYSHIVQFPDITEAQINNLKSQFRASINDSLANF